jgi:hypothetical protein
LLNEIIIDAGVLRIRAEIKMTGGNIAPTLGHPAINPATSEAQSGLANPGETKGTGSSNAMNGPNTQCHAFVSHRVGE